MKKSLRPGDIVLRREKGQPNGQIMGRAVVLRLNVKTQLPTLTSDYQKVKFCFEGADPTKRGSRSVGDLFFKDVVGKSKDKVFKDYISRKRKEDKVAAKAEAAKVREHRGKIPVKLYEVLKTNEAAVSALRKLFS